MTSAIASDGVAAAGSAAAERRPTAARTAARLGIGLALIRSRAAFGQSLLRLVPESSVVV